MDRAKFEFVVDAEAQDQDRETSLVELNELELALVGGGNGDTILH